MEQSHYHSKRSDPCYEQKRQAQIEVLREVLIRLDDGERFAEFADEHIEGATLMVNMIMTEVCGHIKELEAQE